MGSNLINLLLIAGICAVVWPVSFERNAFIREAVALLCITLATWCIFRTREVFSRIVGLMFVVTYFLVMFLVRAF